MWALILCKSREKSSLNELTNGTMMPLNILINTSLSCLHFNTVLSICTMHRDIWKSRYQGANIRCERWLCSVRSFHVCPRDCYDSCGMILQNGRVGDSNHPFTSGFTCGKAALSLRQVSDPERITKALVRTKKGFEKISIDKAISIAAEKLSSNKVYRIDYSGHMGLLSRFFHQRLLRRLGAPELVWDICSTAAMLL